MKKISNMKLRNSIIGFAGVLILMLGLAYTFTGQYSSRANYLINDGSLADGDTILSGWYDIGGAQNVAAVLEVSDSVTARVDFFYRFGTGGQRVACIPISDSIGIQNEGGATWTHKQKELRGYGLTYTRVRSAGDTVRSAIPGAGQIQAKVTVGDVNTDGTNGANRVRVGIISTD